ncbi:hypothetical protein [Francisella philomiragia]|uniref:hypothetical protein n=1 Tax=Francisella philomiragia TaxID=28110 RepID=UPI00190824F5|nr:hypothetical protein [Francisella philomiragia]MBK2266659.1 hypothetical protein [Francisella philomiragia]MBK2278173.1 hypothetical protein [Francisella philomiragia]MBK2286029.1 hypothetical protein [Francisella philomiragia]MBK2287942.1 hypothetical protein [Francisella philomiragia]MBK2289988.1 hypothetical protein [Francisella philomiragia]
MKNKNLFLFVLLVILTVIVLVLFYRFAQWYEQKLGTIFSYIVMIGITLFVFTPFKFIKDNKAKINIINYFKYLGVSILKVAQIVVTIIKEASLTIMYLVTRLFAKDSSESK